VMIGTLACSQVPVMIGTLASGQALLCCTKHTSVETSCYLS